MEVFTELIKYEPGFLDRPLAELVPLRFLGEVAVDAYKALIKRIDNIPMAQEEREAKLKDGQDAGKALLSIEGKIGELQQFLARTSGERSANGKNILKPGELEKANLTIKQAFISRQIADHPEEVEEVIKEAEENDDIPTKTAVLNKIKYKKELERKTEHREKMQIEMRADAIIYQNILMKIINILPTEPPQELNETEYQELNALWQIIFHRGRFFDEQKESEVKEIADQ